MAVGLLAAAFLVGLGAVLYLSLQGSEVQVPEITGKDLLQGERELAALGLKIKKRADRTSSEPINTVIEQLPKPGETVKTGQMILVVTSKGGGENLPGSQKKITEEDDTEKIEEMIDDKPKKSKNANSSRKKADTARDVTANSETGSDVESTVQSSNSNKKEPGASNDPVEKPKKNEQPPDKKEKPAAGGKTSGETRPKPPARQ